jgi:pyridoxal phosphate enzyme (YggS family)
MNSIARNIEEIKNRIPENVQLIAVSKTHPANLVSLAVQSGQLDFGENRVQELLEKQPLLPENLRWHLIGHLQTNKVKYIAPFIYMIHSVDSFRLLEEIDKQAKKFNRVIKVLLQFHIADEETKFGLSLFEAEELLLEYKKGKFGNVEICGVMGMATFTEDSIKVEKEFNKLQTIYKTLQKDHFSQQPNFREISMGMSGDWPLAVKHGATMIRVGSSIFGGRS